MKKIDSKISKFIAENRILLSSMRSHVGIHSNMEVDDVVRERASKTEPLCGLGRAKNMILSSLNSLLWTVSSLARCEVMWEFTAIRR